MMKFAWDSYVQYAWGQNELKPLSHQGHSASVFGNTALGATIVDALDTLYIMGLKDEFNRGHDWVQNSFSFDGVSQFKNFLIVRSLNLVVISKVLVCESLHIV